MLGWLFFKIMVLLIGKKIFQYDWDSKIKLNSFFYIYYCCQTINGIQNKSFCLHNVHIYYVYIYIYIYTYINTHTYSIYFENMYMYIFI